ncbi:MAG: glycosyltransferase family 4 protein [Deltaproteobacteria bacterium]|nr:glycosyltransferase family 4 protein [Deltaproteobacteria bacterium]MCL5791429.1 glycosyltransferase family 4 protein [Deltaproteobacteria bacterium]
MRILILSPHPIESPGPRFRIYQYLSYFKEAGIEYKVGAFLNSAEYMHIYNDPATSLFEKSNAMVKGLLRQIHNISDIKSYDEVIVYREAILFGRPWIERYISMRKIPIIFDFDDAIWMPVKSTTGISPFLKRLIKSERKFDEIIGLSTHIIAGNNYLVSHAKLYNDHISVIPTIVDTDYYKSTDIKQDKSNVVIGWIGSGSTAMYLKLLDNIWKRLPENCSLKIIGGGYNPDGIKTENVKWSLDTELTEMSEFDIGIMPLPDNEWTRGKCGLKVLQYMAMEMPCAASPVGVNTGIIQDGINGFLAKDEKEWVEKLSLLIENPELRQRLGMAGRKTVEERYSVKDWAPVYLKIIKEVINKKR